MINKINARKSETIAGGDFSVLGDRRQAALGQSRRLAAVVPCEEDRRIRIQWNGRLRAYGVEERVRDRTGPAWTAVERGREGAEGGEGSLRCSR